ncbi:MAG: hypothetical protein WDZ80_04300 [Candidatus Paceibacterota bacterium]
MSRKVFPERYDIPHKNYITISEAIQKSIVQLQKVYEWDNNTDIRIRIFNNLNNLVLSNSINMLLTREYVCDLDWLNKIYNIDNEDHAHYLLGNFVAISINGYFYSLTSIIENFFRSTVRTVRPGNKGVSSITKIQKSLFESLGKDSNTYKSKYKELLRLIFILRNRIHNNGIYIDPKHPEEHIKYRDQTYTFIHGNFQHYLDQQLLIYFTCDVYEMILDIVQHEKIKKHSVIEDASAGVR